MTRCHTRPPSSNQRPLRPVASLDSVLTGSSLGLGRYRGRRAFPTGEGRAGGESPGQRERAAEQKGDVESGGQAPALTRAPWARLAVRWPATVARIASPSDPPN